MVFQKFLQSLQENGFASISFFVKLQAVPATLLRRLDSCFIVNFCEMFKNTYFEEYLPAAVSVNAKVLFFRSKKVITKLSTYIVLW